MEPAMKMTGIEHVVYGADCSVPCSTEETMEENRLAVREIARRHKGDEDWVGLDGFELFQSAAARARSVSSIHVH
jgi:hypothetical protein